MNTHNLTQLIQQGLRVTLGATASLVETLHDPQKRNENLTQLQVELNQLARDWAAKGEMTEREARNFVDSLLRQQGQPDSTQTPSESVSNPSVETVPSSAELEVQELTAQLAAIRAELERLRDPEANS